MKKRYWKTMASTLAEKILVLDDVLTDMYAERNEARDVAVSMHDKTIELETRLAEMEKAILKYENLIGGENAAH